MKHAVITRDLSRDLSHGASQHASRSHAHRVPAGWRRMPAFAVEHLLVVPAGAVIALVWANLHAESYYRTVYPLAFAVNDIGMALFFGLITKEVVEATALGGVLHSWRRLMLPIVAAIGATLLPALLFVRAADALDHPMLRQWWLIACAVDVAFGYFVARLVFRRHAAVPFFLVMALAANAFGFVMLALYFPGDEPHPGFGAGLFAAAIAAAGALRRARVRSFWPYLAGPGTLSWAAFYVGGVHPAFALLPVVPFLPHAARDPGFFVDAPPTAHDALSRFEIVFRYPAHLALFLFAVVNSGWVIHSLESGTWALPIAVIAGKPIGVLAAVAIGVAGGLRLPRQIGWRELLVVGLLAAIGFTTGLFFTAAAMAPGQALNEMRAGLLLGLAGGALGIAAAKLLRVGRFAAVSH